MTLVFCLMTVIVHIVPHARDMGIAPGRAAGVLSTIGAVSMIGRFVTGMAIDRTGSRKTMIVSFVLLLTALLWLQRADAPWMLYAFACVYGLAHGAFFTAISPIVAELFGIGSHGALFGIVLCFGTVGGALGPTLAGTLFDVTGSYRPAFWLITGMSAVGFGLILSLKPVDPKRTVSLEASAPAYGAGTGTDIRRLPAGAFGGILSPPSKRGRNPERHSTAMEGQRMTQRCHIVLEAKTLPEVKSRQVRRRLAALLKIDDDAIAGLLARAPVVIRKNIDRTLAEQYRAALERAGAVCRVVAAGADMAGPPPEGAKPNPLTVPVIGHTYEGGDMIVTNIESVPGKTIVEHFGLVSGSTIRAKHIGRDIMASLKNLVGGELKGYTQLLQESRRQAMDRMMEQARQLGANAIVNVRFSTSSVAQGAAELYAYGTAVRVESEGRNG